MRKYLKDIILILSLVLVFSVILLIFLFTGKTDNDAYIYHDDELLLTVSLDKDSTYEVQGDVSLVKIEVKNKTIRVTESGCRDHVCVNVGAISNSNQVITCLPNHIVIKLKEVKGADIIL